MKAVFVLLLAAGAASAQNSDLGLLLGVSGPTSQVVTGTQTRVSASVGASVQINYARQVWEGGAGRLYLELPLLIGARTSSSVESIVRASEQTGIYFTPGVRFNVTLHPRASFYVAGGAGVASF